MKTITEYLSYLPASQEPLSADVYVISGEEKCYIYDVGNNEESFNEISAMTKDKVIILSHFHKDHTGNIHRLNAREVYVGNLTHKKINQGTVITDKLVIDDGVKLEIRRCPSPHVKGSLIVTVNHEYTLIADLYYTRPDYNKMLAQQMLDVLESVDTKYFVVSHQEENNIVEKNELIRELKEFFGINVRG